MTKEAEISITWFTIEAINLIIDLTIDIRQWIFSVYADKLPNYLLLLSLPSTFVSFGAERG